MPQGSSQHQEHQSLEALTPILQTWKTRLMIPSCGSWVASLRDQLWLRERGFIGTLVEEKLQNQARGEKYPGDIQGPRRGPGHGQMELGEEVPCSPGQEAGTWPGRWHSSLSNLALKQRARTDSPGHQEVYPWDAGTPFCQQPLARRQFPTGLPWLLGRMGQPAPSPERCLDAEWRLDCVCAFSP